MVTRRLTRTVGGPPRLQDRAQRLSLVALERLAVGVARLGHTRGKAGVVIVKRRAGCGRPTARLVVMTETGFRGLAGVARVESVISGNGSTAPNEGGEQA